MDNLLEYIYARCATRIDKRIIKEKKTLEDVYRVDPYLISRIRNNKRSKKNNPYLVPDRAFEKYYTEDCKQDGLLTALTFNNRQEVLWGDEDERNDMLLDLYNLIIKYMLNNSSTEELTERFLCDYVEYAYYHTYYEIFLNTKNEYPALFYGVIEDDIYARIDDIREEAIRFMYNRCKDDFSQLMLRFMQNTTSFNKLNLKIERELIGSQVIPMMEKYNNAEDSLGQRTVTLIKGDLVQVAEIMSTNTSTELQRKLINTTTSYLFKISEIQKEYY